MLVKYSKPAADVSPETLSDLAGNDLLLERERSYTPLLRGCAPRQSCIVCGDALAGADCFNHRGVEYVFCRRCHHLQSYRQPPADYPRLDGQSLSFADLYPQLSEDEYRSRTDRIYAPKLEWILECGARLGMPVEQMLARSWLELGCGSGYFLSALRNRGANKIGGLERDEQLVATANRILPNAPVRSFSGPLSTAVRDNRADIYAAFFVLEHIADTKQLFENLRAAPAGTVFVFAVPTFGFSALLEGISSVQAARVLEGVFHTQLYTDRSIAYVLESAGFELAAQWVFGGDMNDFLRLAALSLEKGGYPKAFVESRVREFNAMLDEMQGVLDRNYLSDSRHVMAIKR